MKPRLRWVPVLRLWMCFMPHRRPVGWGYDARHAFKDWQDACKVTEIHHV
jgi:hypothetical protein